jgi:hypothetical protein
VSGSLSPRDLVDLLPLQVPIFLLCYGSSVLIVGAVNSGLDIRHGRSPGAPALAEIRRCVKAHASRRPSVHHEMNLDAPRNLQPQPRASDAALAAYGGVPLLRPQSYLPLDNGVCSTSGTQTK